MPRDPRSLPSQLTVLGLSSDEAALYAELLTRPPEPLDARAGLFDGDKDGERLASACEGLVTLGLVEAPGSVGGPIVPMPPATSLEILARLRTAEVDRARLAACGAYQGFRRQKLSAAAGSAVECVTGADAIEHRINEALNGARREIRMLDSPPYFRPARLGTDQTVALLARGVAHRTVYSRASLEHAGNFTANVEPCLESGEQARFVEVVPVKLTLVDDDLALVSSSLAEADVNLALLLVRSGGLLSALSALFESVWERALPLPHRGMGLVPATALHPVERRILTLLAAGVSDVHIVREIGISRRTFYRRLELLMAKAGATSRFQLALRARERGWL
ncbi:LuxR family transcriptional regulator [Streptomyces sp. NPDC093586]|uniref:LuxR family transcriptional regulator n=1 Tax=Streptomyces sp. NPDC093586 TaxID=3366042 RepID=UPI003811B457